MTTALLMILAVLLDWLLGEPRRRHPLAGFGRWAAWLETRLYHPSRLRGALAWLLAVAPLTALAWALAQLPWVGMVFSVWALYFALGHKSLHDHLLPIVAALEAGDETQARRLTARVVSRDEATLEIVPSALESALENGNDGVFGALFWFAVAGAPGAVLYRLANTLDAMWGYRNARYQRFGWAAARIDDALNYLPARLTALTYALLGRTRQALACWRRQAPAWDGINPGVVMAAGAGALGVRLGGPARYHGTLEHRPELGTGAAPVAADIPRALALVRHGVALWLALWLAGLAAWGWLHA
ncbi:MAG: cobalamin biosynthesis protein [Betaproteobacteria bacterium]|nr:cobalamin biosynthesis protein [Betaproteobacteria bacterium]